MNKRSAKINQIISIIIVFSIFMPSDFLYIHNSEVKSKLKETYSIVSEKENTIQIVCVGNSDLYSGFSPLDLWNEYGFTSTICASAQQTVEESHYFVSNLLKSQKPQFIIIETDMFYDCNPNQSNYCKKYNSITDFLYRISPDFIQQDFQSLISVFSRNKQSYTHGYRYSSKICNINYNQYMNKTNHSDNISEYNMEQIEDLISCCNKNNIQVLFVTMPSISSWNYERHNAVFEYAKSKNIDYIDFNLIYSDIGVDPSICYRDTGNHLNYYGAKIVTKYIGKYIKSRYSLDSLKQNADFEYWNDDYSSFLKSVI